MLECMTALLCTAIIYAKHVSNLREIGNAQHANQPPNCIAHLAGRKFKVV